MKKAFTLIELLVVIATIGLLASIVLVSLQGGREKAQTAKTLQWARSVEAQLGGDRVGSWSFNEGTGIMALDASGYNNGTLGGTCGANCVPQWTNGVQGLTGGALQFDGIDDYVRVPANLRFETIHGPSTLSLWFKATSLSGTKRIFSDNCFEWGIYHNGSTIYGAAYAGVNGGVVSTDQWYNAVLVHEHPTGLTNTKIRFYVNGVFKGEANRTITTESGYTDSPYYVGADSCTPGTYFTGAVDEVRIYSRALTAMEIQKHYAEDLPRHPLAEGR